ncbi:MAG: hypothetical protein P8X70_01355 [Nanoarchaeota archaeon]
MRKELIVLFVLGIFLILPIISAQEQTETYSGFDRFIDNVRMFFSFGDSKVMLALEIREKEVSAAMVNTRNENDEEADKNLKNAWEKLQVIQEKVSLGTADEIKENSYEIRNRIKEQGNLSKDFEVYVLEEEKTGLTAEWVIEINGTKGQNLTNEEVVNETIGQTKVVEIEKRIDQIDNEISNWVVEHTYAEGTTAGGEAGVVVEGGLTKVVKTEVSQGDNGLKPEVKNSVASGGHEDNIVEKQKTKDNIHQLPSFPNNSLGEKFSQDTIKKAVTGRKEGESALETKASEESEKRMFQGHNKKLSREFPSNQNMPKEIQENPKRTKETEPIFIRIDKFEESLEIFKKIKSQISEIQKMLEHIKEVKEKEDKELEIWEQEIKKTKDQVQKVDENIFSKIE